MVCLITQKSWENEVENLNCILASFTLDEKKMVDLIVGEFEVY